MDRKETIVVRLSKDEKNIFEIMAGKKGLPVATYIRTLIITSYYEGKKEKR